MKTALHEPPTPVEQPGEKLRDSPKETPGVVKKELPLLSPTPTAEVLGRYPLEILKDRHSPDPGPKPKPTLWRGDVVATLSGAAEAPSPFQPAPAVEEPQAADPPQGDGGGQAEYLPAAPDEMPTGPNVDSMEGEEFVTTDTGALTQSATEMSTVEEDPEEDMVAAALEYDLETRMMEMKEREMRLKQEQVEAAKEARKLEIELETQKARRAEATRKEKGASSGSASAMPPPVKPRAAGKPKGEAVAKEVAKLEGRKTGVGSSSVPQISRNQGTA